MTRTMTRLLLRQRRVSAASSPVACSRHSRRPFARQFTSHSATPTLSPSSLDPHKPSRPSLPSHTLACTYSHTGDPSAVLSVTRLPLPARLQPDELLLRYLASPINPSDLNMLEGTYPLSPPSLPATAGNEGVAVVEAVGSAVSGVGPGAWVSPLRPTLGTWRQWAVVRSADVEAVPAGLTPQQAALLSVNPCTAYRLLRDMAPLQAGAVVAQNAATSAVGLSVIQIARQLGLTTVNLIRPRDTPAATQRTVEQLTALGATHVLVEDEQLASRLAALPPAALALNGIGGASSASLFRALKGAPGGGVHATYGGMSRRPVTVGAGNLIFGDVTVKGFWMSRWHEANERSEERARMREAVGGWMREGKLRLDVEEVLLREEGVEGIRHALQRNAEPFKMKKVLLSFDSPDGGVDNT